MKIITMYEAKDGKLFGSKEQCVEYEQQCEDARAANNMLENGATLMAALTRANHTRPWWDCGISLEEKVILMKTTKNTDFIIRHWQCSEKPQYKIQSINASGQIYLSDELSGYGNFVELKDLLRYARNTATNALDNY